MDQINFFYEDIDFELDHQDQVSNWILQVIQAEDLTLDSLNYIFCSDEYLLGVNIEYLNHDYYTDIITFDNAEDEEICGDLFISIERVKDNAETIKVSFEQELHRIIVHGTLHLLGYNDKTEEEIKVMREKENAYLTLQNFKI